MDIPTTRYTDVGGRSVAYQIFGSGPRDLLIVPGVLSHLELSWGDPGYAHFMRRLGAFARVITYDRIGVGLSDPVPTFPTLDDRLAEIEAVLDAAGSKTCDVLGYSEGGAFAGFFAASHPERVTSITFLVPWVRGPRTDPKEGIRPVALAKLAACIDHWGEGMTIDVLAPSLADSPIQRRLFGTAERLSAGPGYARGILASAERTDVSAILAHIRVPCLVIGVTRDAVVPIEHVRAIAAAIAGARYFEMPGTDHFIFCSDFDPAVDEMERFMTGQLTGHDVDRVLATVVFTDIVGSTQRLAKMGDRAWRQLVGEHDERVRLALDEHGGREVKTLGDGFLLLFDAPHTALIALKAIQGSVAEIGLEVRAGVHTGDVEIAGVDVAGMTVNTAARISALAGAGEVLVSGTVKDLLGPTGTVCTDRGAHELKGVPGKHVLFAAADPERYSLEGDERTIKFRDRVSLAMARRAPGLVQSLSARLRPRPVPAA